MTGDLNLPFRHFERPVPDADVLLHKMKQYVAHTLLSGPVSSVLQLDNYECLRNDTGILIDGGFGEFWRREFFHRLYILGGAAVRHKDVDRIMPFIKYPKAAIFNPEILNEMEEGCRDDLKGILEQLPSPDDIGYENWLDWFALKTRLPNYGGPEQIRLDSVTACFMPYIQRSLMIRLFGMPVHQRKNGRLFRHLIRKNRPALTKYPLVKGQGTHPYFLNSIQTRVWHKIMHKLGIITPDTRVEQSLDLMSEYIQDLVYSREIRECDWYHYPAIQSMWEEYLIDGKRNAFQLDWWLSFELLRQTLFG